MLKLDSILGKMSKTIEVVNRKSGEKFIEKIYGEDAMKVLYGSSFAANLTEKLFTNKFVSNIYGAYNDAVISKHKVEDFIKQFDVDMSESEKKAADFYSFNDFFSRKLKPEARPIAADANAIVSSGDGRLLVFPQISEETISYVKWAPIPLVDLFHGDVTLSKQFKDGACAVLRICPSDYHRFHFPMAGQVGVTKSIPGLLHSVNPYAIEKNIPVFCVNKRTLCELETTSIGKVLLLEVGAMFVGSIVQTYRPGSVVEKGMEKGFFKFGGSTTVLFFQANTVKFDQDLIDNSSAGLETLIKMGEQIATTV